tara:strand:- start:17695 stop:17949 length:255 start_codon:yes stop_codon:yes gene_type:complete
LDHKRIKKEIMPEIILKKELKRKFGELEKVFPEGSKYFVNWQGYQDLLKDGYCDQIEVEVAKKPKLKAKKKKIENLKENDHGNN